MGKVLDLKGAKFGRLKVLEKVGTNYRGAVVWLCRCKCGREIEVEAHNLTHRKERKDGKGICCLECARMDRVGVYYGGGGIKRDCELTAEDLEGFRRRELTLMDLVAKYKAAPQTVSRWLKGVVKKKSAMLLRVEDVVAAMVGSDGLRRKSEVVAFVAERLCVTKCVAKFLVYGVNSAIEVDERGKKVMSLAKRGKTLKEIGEVVGVSKERIRQILVWVTGAAARKKVEQRREEEWRKKNEGLNGK